MVSGRWRRGMGEIRGFFIGCSSLRGNIGYSVLVFYFLIVVFVGRLYIWRWGCWVFGGVRVSCLV